MLEGNQLHLLQELASADNTTVGWAVLQIKLLRVEEALHKCDHGTYGLCESCGESIPVERLREYPDVCMCVSCQRMLEEKRRRVYAFHH